MIAAANDDKADSVSVSWPPCQQCPDRVSVDPKVRTLDEEYGSTVADVKLGNPRNPAQLRPIFGLRASRASL